MIYTEKNSEKAMIVALQSHTKGKSDIKYTKTAKKHNRRVDF